MNKFLNILILLCLLYQYWFWYDWAVINNTIPSFFMFTLNTVGILLVSALAFSNKPTKSLSITTLIWCTIFTIDGIYKFQMFNFEGIIGTLVMPTILYLLFISPVVLLSLRTIKTHNKALNSDTAKDAAPVS